MRPQLDQLYRLPLRLSVLLLAAALAACSDDPEPSPYPTVPMANPAVAQQLSGVDALGVGGTGLVSGNPAYADLNLRANLAGGVVQLRFSCTGCSITVSAAGSTVGANQYISIPFPALEASSDVPVTVTDTRSNQVATYTLRARPIDHAPFNAAVITTPQPGDLYLTPFDPHGHGAAFAYIVDNNGRLKYYYRNPPRREILDFKKTIIPGGVTRYSFYDEAVQGIRVMDANFNTLTIVQAQPFPDGNTYAIDGHDHVIVDDGHYIVGVYAAKAVSNIPALPGQTLNVLGTGLQEIVNGAATFSWLSTDHPELYACSARGNNYAASNGADYAHWDSLVVDGDGNWIASFRHLDSVLKINRADGSIPWILGGPCDQFALSADQKFTSPHDAQRAPDGRLTLFDVAPAGSRSRVLAFGLNEAGKTATSFTAYTTDAHYSYNLGSAQLFASGRALVGWGEFDGQQSDVTEYDTASGALSFQLTLLPSPWTYGYFSYRARKFP
ncbi:MAG TPA: arylsulfotransferase family protein [Rhizobacter sp.]|nr:arylsulfotransferase family protein [Rhizobacter sp.]